ncbi:MAG: CRISPR-associated endonuclease Cas1 [Terriglobales bacterium]
MAAAQTVPQPLSSGKSPISKSGVLTLSGFGVRVRMQNGHLEIEDGVGLERRKFRLPRVAHNLRRLVCICDDGFVTLSALKWLADTGASFVMLDRMGKVLFVTGPTAPSDARLRRAQAVAPQNGMALEISRELIGAKLAGQELIVREKLNEVAIADAIARCRERLVSTETIDAVRSFEAQAAAAYWSAWYTVRVTFPQREVKRLPQHWLTFGTRKSPLTGSPRLAVNPAGAILNYCYALLESESRLALAALGLDPGLGMLHADTPARDSLACDLMEAVRPCVDGWLLDWITREPLLRSWFIETETGNCRLTRELASKLSETSPTWGRFVAPYAERIASMLWSRRFASSREAVPPTRLTQNRKRQAKGAPLATVVPSPAPQRRCRGCGKALREGRTHCATCAVPLATERLRVAAQNGRAVSHTPEARAKLGTTQRQHRLAEGAWSPAEQPGWLTTEFYDRRIQPRLAKFSNSVIASRIEVSRAYVGKMKKGYRPHPRHWQALAEMVRVASQ